MVIKNTKNDKLGLKKQYAKKDTSYSSFWLYNREAEMEVLKDTFVNFYNDKELLSEFNPTVAKNIISFWSEEGDIILDPFSGRTRALVSHFMNRRYIGYEISKDVNDYMNGKIDELELEMSDNNFISVINDDCLNINDTFKTEYFDMVFTCPPYWDLEKYESCEGQLSDVKEYDVFMNGLVNRLIESVKVLKPGGYMCIVIGDFRRKGKYIKLHSDLLQKLDFYSEIISLHDIVTMQNIPFNTAAFYFGSKKKYKYTAKSHEYLLVWRKK